MDLGRRPSDPKGHMSVCKASALLSPIKYPIKYILKTKAETISQATHISRANYVIEFKKIVVLQVVLYANVVINSLEGNDNGASSPCEMKILEMAQIEMKVWGGCFSSFESSPGRVIVQLDFEWDRMVSH